mgnify:CR=1 FL=1
MYNKYAVKLALRYRVKFFFIALHSSVFGKLREMLDEIKYSFVSIKRAEVIDR